MCTEDVIDSDKYCPISRLLSPINFLQMQAKNREAKKEIQWKDNDCRFLTFIESFRWNQSYSRAFCDYYFLWGSPGSWSNCFNRLYHILAIRCSAKDYIMAVKPISRSHCNEKLTFIGVRAGIGHGNAEWFMIELKVLIIEGLSPYRHSSSAISVGNISSLIHKSRNNSMKGAADKCQSFSLNNGVSLANLNKILYCFRNNLSIHIQNNVSCCLSSDVNTQDDFMSHIILHKMSFTFSSSQTAVVIMQTRRIKLIFINYQISFPNS